MTQQAECRVLYVIVCGAGPAGEVGRLVELAHDRGWTVQIIATPSALAFIDVPKLEAPDRPDSAQRIPPPRRTQVPAGRREACLGSACHRSAACC
jgi:hypothetical protein